MPYNDHTHIVLAPTKPDDAYAQEDADDLDSERNELKTMAGKDVQFLVNQGTNVARTFIQTGSDELATCFTQLSALGAGTAITFILSAHGSPGPRGKIGMGHDAADKPAYRLSATELAQLLEAQGIKKLKKLDLTFRFQCCNSGYVPMLLNTWRAHTGKADYQQKIQKRISEYSFVGCFYQALLDATKLSVNVTGFRGFYYPDVRSPRVAGKTSASERDKKPLSDGQVNIKSSWEVEIDTDRFDTWLKIQTPTLDALFPVAAKD